MNPKLMKANNLYLPSLINPEHYYFDAPKGGRQVIMETFGMYKDPAYLDLRLANVVDPPVKPDPDADLVLHGKTLLATNEKDTTIYGMHQIKSIPNGMKIKLGVFLPQAAPAEIVKGHRWHMLIEFNNFLHPAVKTKPTMMQNIKSKIAIKLLEAKQKF